MEPERKKPNSMTTHNHEYYQAEIYYQAESILDN